ncbi:MAG TPA: TCR/Tet family MFS transporter [Rhizomicrobium sp.]|jgi:DHA1 family tetracycline resistance protein-like MFS transporter|nr:TCR/Tet family MFS transporter [Rhizomicrobium sp.]
MKSLVPRRANVALVLAVVYIDMLGLGLAFPILPRLVQQFEGGNFSRASWVFGLLASAYALMQFLLAPALGALSDRFGRRPILLLSLLGMGVNYLVLATAPSLAWLVIGRVIAGAMGASYSTASAYLADITPPEKRAQSFGLIGAAFGFGFITGPAIGGFLGDIDLRLPFLVASGLSFANLVFGLFILPESLAPENRRAFRLARANPVGALADIGRYKLVLPLVAVFVLATFANKVAETTWVLFATYRFHWSAGAVGLSLAMVGVIFVVGQGGLVRIVVPRLGERRAILVGLLVSAVVMVLYGIVPQGWMVYPVMCLMLFGWIVAQPTTMGLMSRALPANEQGLLQGVVASINSLCAILAPPVWAAIFAYFVSPAAPLVVPGAAFDGAALVFLAALVVAVRTLSPKTAAASSPQPEPA